MAKISRRTFIKGTGVALGTLAAAPLVSAQKAVSGPELDTFSKMSASHWGAFNARVEGGRFVQVTPFANDPFPSPMLQALPARTYAPDRIKYPMVRAGYLKNGYADMIVVNGKIVSMRSTSCRRPRLPRRPSSSLPK